MLGTAENIYRFQAHSSARSVAIHQLVELLLDCLIVPSLNSMQKEQECQNRTQEHETEVGTSMYRPPNLATTAAKRYYC
jgi:hypothetical protein